MKIIVLINSFYAGGAEFSTLSFYSWLIKHHNVEVKIVYLKKAEPSYDLREFEINDPIYLKSNFLLGGKLNQFKNLITEFNPDIVHSVLFEANILGRISRLFIGGFLHIESLVNETYSPHRLTDPNVTFLKLQAYRLLDFVTQLFGVDHFHANGKSVATHYQKKLFVNPKRITIIPRGRKGNAFVNDRQNKEQIRKELKTGNKVQLINVARQESQKAQTILLDALHKIDTLNDKYILLLVGREGQETRAIKQKIEQYKLTESVRVLGHRKDVPNLLAASDVFVFPSRFEGLSGALIEAEAAGLPIICSDIPNNFEVVEDQKNALTFPVDDSEKLAQHIKNLILAPERRKKMGAESLRIYNSQFTIEGVHQKMFQMLSSLTKTG